MPTLGAGNMLASAFASAKLARVPFIFQLPAASLRAIAPLSLNVFGASLQRRRDSQGMERLFALL
jgi:hypothetical protein